jgi:hypothetical protein
MRTSIETDFGLLGKVAVAAAILFAATLAMANNGYPYNMGGNSGMPVSNPGAMPFAPGQMQGEQNGLVQVANNGCFVGRNEKTRTVNGSEGPRALPPAEHTY